MTQGTVDHVQDKVFASAALSDAAGIASTKFDQFASWLLAGFGGAIALMMSGEKSQTLIPTATLHDCLVGFAWATVCVVVGKYLSALITGAAESGRMGRDRMDKLIAAGTDLSNFNLEVLMTETKRGLFWPSSLLAGRHCKDGHLGRPLTSLTSDDLDAYLGFELV